MEKTNFKGTKGMWFFSNREVIAMPSQVKICKVHTVSLADSESGFQETNTNAGLIAEAGNVRQMTNCTLTELLMQRNELLKAINSLRGIEAWINDGQMKTLFQKTVNDVNKLCENESRDS